LKPVSRLLRAICTLIAVVQFCLLVAPAENASAADTAGYRNDQVSRGAPRLPVLARLSYRDATVALSEGHRDAAMEHLRRAIAYDPNYPDPYFTLSRVTVVDLDIEAAVLLARGVAAMWRNFPSQALVVVNVVVITPYVLMLITLIVCFAFSVKYLPFGAHKLREFLQTRFRASLPGLSAYLVLLIPLILVPGVISALAYLMIACWLFMYWRERLVMIVLVIPFIALGLFGSYLAPLSPLVDPGSLTSLIARANESPGDRQLAAALSEARVEGLEGERRIALGLVQQRQGDYLSAANNYFQAISEKPTDPMGYVNLGNVYYLQGQYEKALEGYRKAESIDPRDPICQHALAQAYIKTLLMKDASKSLQLAATYGIEDVKETYSEYSLAKVAVFPKTFSNMQLWRIASFEGKVASQDYLNQVLMPLTRFPRRVCGWILLGALVLGVVLARVVNAGKLTFQCSNCARLICNTCCDSTREYDLCQDCATAIERVTSEKVIEALLRQKRQAAIVSRRKSSRFVTMILPGVKDLFEGRIARGFTIAALFSFAVVQLFTGGFFITDASSLLDHVPLWKTILAAAGVVITYMMSIFPKRRYGFQAHRRRSSKTRSRGASQEGTETQVA
jgi:tetratricopeptide (TPR) repeat protein